MGTVHQFPVPCNQPAAEPVQELARALRVAIDAEVGAAAPFAGCLRYLLLVMRG